MSVMVRIFINTCHDRDYTLAAFSMHPPNRALFTAVMMLSTIRSLSNCRAARSRTLWRSIVWACSMASMKPARARTSLSDSA